LFETKIKLAKNEKRKFADMRQQYAKNLNEQEIILKLLSEKDSIYSKDYQTAKYLNNKFNNRR
jgi:hypothetical protein